MNRLNVSLQASILALHDRGWSRRRIARELQLDRATVRRHVLASKAAISTPGSGDEAGAKPAISTPGSTAGRVSACREFLPVIEAGIGARLSAKRIHQDLAGLKKGSGFDM